MIFDQYQRYKTIQVIVKYIKDLYHLERVSILELGANEECNLEKVLPSENIQYSDIKLSDQMKQSGKFVEADGTNLYQFEDQSYDIVIALDVLEHVPDNARESFLFEAHRVSKYMAIMCFPYDSLYNSSAEKCANNYYKAIYGCDHIWLKEHIENGLPKLDAIRHLMNKTEINYTLVHHGSTMLWEEMIKALFASYHSNKYFDLMESLDEFYAEYIYRHDMVQKSYRVFLMMGRDNKEIKKIEEYLNHYFDGDIAQEDLQHLYLNIEDLKRLGERKEEKVEESNHKVKIYYDYGRGYNEADTRMVEAKAITNDKYRVSLLEYNVQDLYNIRIDPVEGSNCMLTRCAIKQGDEQLSLGYSMHIEGNSGVILLGDDPILMTSIKNQEMPISIELEFIVEGKEFTEEVLRNYATQIEDTKDKDKAIYEWNEKCNASQERIVILEQEQKKKEEYIIQLEREQVEKENYIQALEEEKAEKEKRINFLEKEKIAVFVKQIEQYERERKEKEKVIFELSQKLEEANRKYDHILSTNSWKLTAPLRAIYKKNKKAIPTEIERSGGEVDISYYVECFKYEEKLLEVEGWIFDQIALQSVGDLAITFEMQGTVLKRYEIDSKDRKDVQEAYQVLSSQIGFGVQMYVENFSKLEIYLEYGNRGKVYLGTIHGDSDDDPDEELHIFLPQKGKYYSLDNIRMCREASEITDYSKETLDKSVDIIIPVYNGYDFLKPLINSAVKTKMKFRFIIINDNSTDERVEPFLQKVKQQYPNTLYIKNEQNLGFVQSVNKGLKEAKTHVVLLNTDVELPEMWLERLMYPILTNSKVATTTPFTNAGTICSFPEFCKDNKIVKGHDVDTLDRYFQKIMPNYTEIPTGVGFCMGMNYQAIKKVGLLDAKTFGKGYGEENDWCQRAIAEGFVNVHVENLYAYHKHGGSFLSEEKKRLLEINSKELSRLHPNYLKNVAEYCKRDTNKVIREAVLFECLKNMEAVTELYFNHNLGGGATDYLLKKEKEIVESNRKYIEIVYDVYEKIYKLKCRYQDYEVKVYANNLEELFVELDSVEIDNIVINELVTYPDVYKVLEKICAFKKAHSAKITMLIHDFYCVCPTINLITPQNRYCYLPDIAQCEQCVVHNQNLGYTDYETVSEWRMHWKAFLSECDEIIAFSNDSKNIVEAVYRTVSNIEVRPHVISYLPALSNKKKHTNALNIGLLGVLSERKGLSIVKSMLKQIEKENLNINLVLIGTCEEKIESEHFIETGKYARERLPYLVCENDIDIFFISSVWPETFSYTAEEIMKMKLPLAVFNLGAPAERVKKYDKGIIIGQMNAETALKEIQNFMLPCISESKISEKRVLCVAEYLSFSSRYRLEHLREEMYLQGIASDFFMLDEVEKADMKEYTEVFIYRCSDYERVNSIVKRAKQRGIIAYYDIDDYIFNYADIKSLDFLKGAEYDNFEEYSKKIYSCMNVCDEFITSTEHMKIAISKAFPDRNVYVNRNKASMEMLVLSMATEISEKADNKVTLGYFSGSKTHNDDFALIENVIVDIMEQYENVYLKIAGCLELGRSFDKFKDRITYLEFMPWQKLPEEITQIDINLMPIENTFFHACKSENKWMEAALVHVPTIASYNDELVQVIEHGKTGILCKSSEEWRSQLGQLVTNKAYRNDIAQAAYENVMSTHLTWNKIDTRE